MKRWIRALGFCQYGRSGILLYREQAKASRCPCLLTPLAGHSFPGSSTLSVEDVVGFMKTSLEGSEIIYLSLLTLFFNSQPPEIVSLAWLIKIRLQKDFNPHAVI